MRALVVTGDEPGARWAPRSASRAEGALTLLRNTVPARSRPEQSLAAVCALTAGARVLIGPRGEAADASAALIELVSVARLG